MAQNLFVAPLLCVDKPDGTRECTPKVNPQQVNYVAECQQSTVPNPQCLVLAVGNTTSAEGDASLLTLIGDNLDAATTSVATNVRNRINNGLTSKGITLTRTVPDPNSTTGGTLVVAATFTDYVTVKDFLTALGKWFNPNFSFDTFWISGAQRLRAG